MSELSAEKLAELRKTAEWEPVVPWTWANGGVFFSSAFGLQPLTLPGSSSQFIAAFDPPTVIALLDLIAELEGQLDAADRQIEARSGKTAGERLFQERCKELEAELAEYRERNPDVHEDGLRDDDGKVIRHIGYSDLSMRELADETGLEWVVRPVWHGPWMEVTDDDE